MQRRRHGKEVFGCYVGGEADDSHERRARKVRTLPSKQRQTEPRNLLRGLSLSSHSSLILSRRCARRIQATALRMQVMCRAWLERAPARAFNSETPSATDVGSCATRGTVNIYVYLAGRLELEGLAMAGFLWRLAMATCYGDLGLPRAPSSSTHAHVDKSISTWGQLMTKSCTRVLQHGVRWLVKTQLN